MKHIIALVLALLLSGNLCSAYSMGYFPKDDPPAVPVPVPDPTPAPTTTTEQGTKSITGAEVDFYFSKPIASYGKFDLRTGGKKYTIRGGYKDANIEVRNSQTKGNMVVIAGAAYRDKIATVIYPSTDAPTVPDATPPPVTLPADGDIPETMGYNHVNQESFDGRGVSIIMCKNAPGLKSVTINGKAMHLHGDRGPNCNRETWTNVDWINKTPTKITGWAIVEAKDGTKKKIKLDGNRKWFEHKGDCFINCGN